MSAPRKGKSRQLAAIGAAVSLAGLAFYLYSTFASSDSRFDRKRFLDGSKEGESSSSAKKRYRATLSLSLPASFVRNDENMKNLKDLLGIVSHSYIVTLIAPPPINSSDGSADRLGNSPDHALVDPSGSGIETVAALSQSLSDVPHFDARRVLEYSKEEGRLALARALSCDAHCEVFLQPLDDRYLATRRPDRSKHEEGADDGDVTPRATSPHRTNDNSDVIDHEATSLLEQYHADMARLRKSSSLLIFLVLPLPSHSQDEAENFLHSKRSISHLDVETLIQPFLLPGQQELSSRVPGVKIVDAKAADSDIGRAWTKAGQRVVALSKGWQ